MNIKQKQKVNQKVIVNIDSNIIKKRRAKRRKGSVRKTIVTQPQFIIPQQQQQFNPFDITRLVREEINVLARPIESFYQTINELKTFQETNDTNFKLQRNDINNIQQYTDIQLQEMKQSINEAIANQTPISYNRPPLYNQELNSPQRLTDDSSNPILSLVRKAVPFQSLPKGQKKITDYSFANALMTETPQVITEEKATPAKKKLKITPEMKQKMLETKEIGTSEKAQEDFPKLGDKKKGRPPKK